MIPDSRKQPLGTIPVPSTSLLDDPTFCSPGGTAELRLQYRKDGLPVRGGIRFLTVRAFRSCAESHCTSWQIQDCYDTLVEVTPSDWVDELRQAQPRPRHDWGMHHYLIYLDSAGAYEVAAAGWEWLPETPV